MTLAPETRQEHPYFMYDAITGQPEAMALMLERHAVGAREVAESLASRRNIYIVGIGTSWHAVLVAEHWFRRFAGQRIQVQGWHSFEFCSYPPALGPEDAVVIISHRGTKTYSFLALELARERGAYTVAVTSTDPGPRLQVADVSFHTVSPERSSAFTISYTTALTVLALLASDLGEITGEAPGSITAGGGGGAGDAARLKDSLLDVPAAVADITDREADIAAVAERFANRQRFISVGWGPNTGNAYEVALKIKETSASDCEGLQVEQLLHGPFCSLDDSCLVTLIAPPGPGYERSLDIARASAAAGAPVWALVQAGDEDLSSLASASFPMKPVPEIWSPLACVAPLQLFTYHLALQRGKHPDLFQQDNPKQAAARVHYNL
ncbi:MAG: SIS domain-containing protein [Chloroflexi bacterium]|nr:SIS domain-containing protein [Chloroflexota bacterium]